MARKKTDVGGKADDIVWISDAENPQNLFDGGLSLASLAAAGHLIYTVGKECIPESKYPFLVTILDSRPIQNENNLLSHEVLIKIRNMTAHGLYIEKFDLKRGDKGNSYSVGLDSNHTPQISEEIGFGASEDNKYHKYPWFIEPERFIVIKLILPPIPEHDNTYKSKPYGAFALTYSCLHEDKEKTTSAIKFRLRIFS